MGKSLSVLIVDDCEDDAVLLSAALQEGGFSVTDHCVEDPLQLQEAVSGRTWDIVLCDNNMPEFDALSALDIVYRHIPDTPFIVVSGDMSEEDASKLMKLGASDFISKHNLSRLVPAVERELRRPLLRGVGKDIWLADRRRMMSELSKKLRSEESIALVLVELCRYQDLVRHAGEALVSCFSERLAEFAVHAKVWRYKEDIFALAMPAESKVLLKKIAESFRMPLVVGTEEWFVNCRAGASVSSGRDMETLLRQAEAALHCARESSTGACFYRPGMDRRARDRLEIERALFHAALNEEFELAYQPQFDLISRKIVGVEALLRWKKNGEQVSPAEFIPVLEETGLIHQVGEWVLRKACEVNKSMQIQGLPSIRMAVNLSAIQFRQQGLPAMVESVLEETGLDAGSLALEITENIAMHHGPEIVSTLNVLRQLGIELALDDFGTGYSSLSYLKHFPVGKLKIDQSFVRDIASVKSNEALVRAIVAIAESFGLGVIAEGVESEEQAELLKECGCTEVQGYHFCRPVTEEELRRLLSN